MTTTVFSPEMMKERERQLIIALSDCAGAYYDVNYTKNTITGTGIVENKSYTDMVDHWGCSIKEEEKEAFYAFFDIQHAYDCYEKGERSIKHQYWMCDGNDQSSMVVQKIQLYKDITTGDLLGLAHIIDDREMTALLQKDANLMEAYQKASSAVSLLEKLSANVPGGYHRCNTTGGFKLEFVSQSFLDVIGWTKEELEKELDNDYINIVAPEDYDFFLSHEPILVQNGRVELVYRIRRRDGTRRWIQDATIRTEKDGKEYYQCTLMDITEYVEKINAEKEKAEASSLAKSTFLFNASHDIRTPMNAIQGYARIIADNVNNPEIVADAVQKIMKSGDMLTTLINDVLEVSRIEHGKDEVEQRALDMNIHMDKLYEMFRFEMEQADIQFVMNNEIEHCMIIGDDLKLTRIAMNLLSNAKKFTPAGGTVFLGVKESGYDGEKAYYILSVRDNGIGMSKEFQERAFEQFERERTSTESGVIGSGLGLAIIKRLCELMNGEYHIESELGKGTEIWVKIPLKIAHEAMDMKDATIDYSLFEGKRILLVEDNEFNREIARYTLENANFIVDEAENGSVCLDKLLKASHGYYDLILMDIQMPVMDGYTATQEIRNIINKKIAQIPIIAMTANAFDEDRQKCIDVGMNGHLGKPLEVDKLMLEIAGVLRNSP